MPTNPASDTLPYIELTPPREVRDYVACIWRSDSGHQLRQTTILPDGCIDIIWQGGAAPFVAGPMTTPVQATTAPGVITLGIRFQPGIGAGLLGVPASALRDLRVPLADFRLTRGQQRALDVVRTSDGLPNAAHSIEAVQALLADAQAPDRFIMHACRWFARHPGEPATAFIAGSGVSERQARRRFQELVGYGPKTLQRILRMQRVLWLMSRPWPSRSLAHLAQAAGYADQAHLTRDLRELTGQLPSALAKNDPQSAVADLFKTQPG